MRSIALLSSALAATAAATLLERQSTTPVALGERCSGNADCPAGVYCYNKPPLTPSAPTAVPLCGGFNATCTSNDQCALNTCNQGLCSGYKSDLPSTTSSAAAAPSNTSNASKLGDRCSRNGDCPASVFCYNNPPLTPSAPTAVPICGGFNATCTSNEQCALNTCISGLCNGYKGDSSGTTSSSASVSSSSTISTSPSAAPNNTSGTAPPRPVTSVVSYASAQLGQPCEVDAQCPSGVQCLNNPPLTPSAPTAAKICGGFNATCSSDNQCALNTCNKGLCSGYKNSPTTGATTTLFTTAPGSTPSAQSTSTASRTSATLVTSTGAASKEGVNAALLFAAGMVVYAL